MRRRRGEGALFQRSNGLWVARVSLGVRNGKRRQRELHARTEAEADRLRTKLDATEARLAEADGTIAQLRRTLIDTIRADRERELEAMRTAELMSPSTFRARVAALRELSNEADELGDYTS